MGHDMATVGGRSIRNTRGDPSGTASLDEISAQYQTEDSGVNEYFILGDRDYRPVY